MEEATNPGESASIPSVLVIEDNIEHANLMRHGLQFHGQKYDVEIVSTLSEARESLRRRQPDIVFSELGFADGKVNELIPDDPETADYPVVVLTDKGSEKEAVELLKAGSLDYIVKTRRKCQEIGDLVGSSLKAWNRIRDIRKAEINLQQTLRLARTIMDSLPTPVGVLDEQGKIISVNNAWLRGSIDPVLFGNTFDVDSNYLAFCQQSEHSTAQEVAGEIQRVFESQCTGQPLHFQAISDEPVWYSVAIHPCLGTGRAKAIVIYQDITDRKILEVKGSERETAERQLDRLTPREKQVMDLVVEGKPNKSIARALDISVKTVEMHRSNMMKKLKLRNVTELVKLAVNAGFHEPDLEPVGSVSQ